MRTLLSMTLTFLLGTLTAQAAPENFDRYQVILDRKPFGDPPIVPEPTPEPAPQAPPWAETYRLVSVTKVEGDDVRVGILDMRSNRAVVLKVGEIEDGIELLSANVQEESAELSKGGEVVTMTLSAAAPGSKPTPPNAGQKKPSRPTPRIQPPGNKQTANPPRTPRGVVRNRVPAPPR